MHGPPIILFNIFICATFPHYALVLVTDLVSPQLTLAKMSKHKCHWRTSWKRGKDPENSKGANKQKVAFKRKYQDLLELQMHYKE